MKLRHISQRFNFLALTRPRAAFGAVLLVLLAIALPGSAQATDPVTYTIDGTVGANGWYRGSSLGDFVRVRWSINVDVLDASQCGSPMKVSGPTTGSVATCKVTLTNNQPLTWQTSPIKIDQDPPTGVAPSLSRGADFNGWFNHPVTVSWGGSDATSGIAGCSSVTYSGPDNGAASVNGGCTDKAGNSASAAISISYDATAPVLSKASVDSRNGSDLVTWKSSSPADTAVVQRWPRGGKAQPVVFRGAGGSFMDKKVAAGLEYMYAVQTFDQAGNASKRTLVAGLAKVVTMRRLPYVPRVAAQPILRWARVRGATYYNVQLYRGSKRVFASWPTTNHLGLPAKWKWAGKWRHLGPGRYRWYVWAGLGRRSFARYQAVGNAQFIVPHR
jgi:hypothetical protein